ncbi:UNVERIFIED_CONTAM: hypothetical protein FKN15_068355 [Acipenser sinensis]
MGDTDMFTHLSPRPPAAVSEHSYKPPLPEYNTWAFVFVFHPPPDRLLCAPKAQFITSHRSAIIALLLQLQSNFT